MSSALHLSSSFEALKKRSRVVTLSWKAARPRIDAMMYGELNMT